jgi:hypothetical protein
MEVRAHGIRRSQADHREVDFVLYGERGLLEVERSAGFLGALRQVSRFAGDRAHPTTADWRPRCRVPMKEEARPSAPTGAENRMKRMGLFATLAGSIASTALATSLAQAAPDSDTVACFGRHTPTVVAPYEIEEFAGEGGSYQALVGARWFVPAEKGLTAEWLNRELLERIARRRADSECPLDLDGVRGVSVQSGGPGFWVNVSAKDTKTARELLRRARLFARADIAP